MPALNIPFDAHMALAIGHMPTPFILGGQTIQGMRSTPSVTETLMLGGTDETVAFDLYARTVDLPKPLPIVGTIMKVDGVDYRVLDPQLSPDKKVLKMKMGYARRGPAHETF